VTVESYYMGVPVGGRLALTFKQRVSIEMTALEFNTVDLPYETNIPMIAAAAQVRGLFMEVWIVTLGIDLEQEVVEITPVQYMQRVGPEPIDRLALLMGDC